MEKLIREVVQPGYERIRRYVIGQIAKAGDKPMRLASNREIAKQFGVSHPTVVKALKDLIADGYLNVKPGCLGTFTNPGRFESMGDVKLIGVLTFDGKTVFDVKLCEEFRHAFSKILLRKSAGYKIQGCFLNGSLSRADEELGLLGLDAIVWFFPTAQAMPAIGRLRASGRIVICAGNVQDECNAIYFDTENLTRRVARLILKEGRRKIMLALPPSANFAPDSIAGLRGAYEEACLPFDQDAQLFIAPLDALDAFSAKIEKLKPDAIIFSRDLARLWDAVKKTLDIENACRLYAMEFMLFDDMGYRGFVGVPSLEKAGADMVANLLARLEGHPPPSPAPIDVEIRVV